MKLWSDTQMFFVVDTEFCQNEADDPQDAIVYFSPQDTPDSTKCTLCCHIMGICRFMKLGFSPVSLIRLSKGKFTIRTLGKYLLALRGGPDMPDTILQRQLNSMIEMFLLLYNGFEAVSNDCNSRADFLNKMADVLSYLLPISQHRGDNLSLTFNIIPSLELPKTAGLLFLQASQFLQACQRFPGVHAGTLFCDKKVLCSQLPVPILSKLAFINDKQRCAGKAAPASFALPGSVRLLFIYLSEQDVRGLNLAQISTSRSASVDPGEGPSGVKKVHQDDEFESTGHVSSSNCRCAMDDISPVQLEANEPDSKVDLSIRGRQKGEHEDDSVPSQADSADQCLELLNTAKPNTSFQDTLETSCSSSDATLTQDTAETLSPAADNNCISKLTSFSLKSSSYSKWSRCPSDELNNYKQYVLYIQGYNDTVLCLILDDGCNDNPKTINGLWKLGMNTLMSLETDVRSCLEMSPSKEQDEMASSSYMYMQYDRKLNKGRGDLKVSKGSSIQRQIFNRSAQLLHEDFVREPQLYESTVCARDLVIYGHKLGARETYFHSKEGSTTDQKFGFPLQSNQMCTIATKAREKLEKERRLMLL